MKRIKYSPKEYKELVSKLLNEKHEICRINGLPNTFYKSAQGIEVLSNFDIVFHSFVNEFPLSNMMSSDQLIFTFKVLLQQQLDSYWYSGFKRYQTNIEIYNDDTLVNFTDHEPIFSYLELEAGKSRVSRWKRFLLNISNSPLKNSVGVFLPYAPVPMYNFLNKLCSDLGTDIVVTNVLRSLEYQNKLLNYGHITPNESSHLYGYTVDIEQKWYKDNNTNIHKKIENHLQKLEEEGQINFVDYGRIWHICLSPCFLHLYLD